MELETTDLGLILEGMVNECEKKNAQIGSLKKLVKVLLEYDFCGCGFCGHKSLSDEQNEVLLKYNLKITSWNKSHINLQYFPTNFCYNPCTGAFPTVIKEIAGSNNKMTQIFSYPPSKEDLCYKTVYRIAKQTPEDCSFFEYLKYVENADLEVVHRLNFCNEDNEFRDGELNPPQILIKVKRDNIGYTLLEQVLKVYTNNS